MNARSTIAFAVTLAAATLPAVAHAGAVEGTVQHSRGSGDMVVWIEVPGVAVHPPATNPVMNQYEIRFDPKILVVVAGTTVDFRNSDPVNHNVFSPDGDAYNLGTWPQGTIRTHTFDTVGSFVQLCTLHPEMEGWVVVVDTPYYAVTDSDGRFRIEGVPDGHYDVGVWGEHLSKAQRKKTFAVDVTGGSGSLAITWAD